MMSKKPIKSCSRRRDFKQLKKENNKLKDKILELEQELKLLHNEWENQSTEYFELISDKYAEEMWKKYA